MKTICTDTERLGYVFNFQGQAFDPNGKAPAMAQPDIDAHNRKLADAEWKAMLQTGRALLYYSGTRESGYTLSTWDGSHKITPYHGREHWHTCFGRRVSRLDFWFTLAGETWHGVNIGDSQIVHVRRNKRA